MAELTRAERTVVDNIYQATQGNSLLERMVTRFASARYTNNRVVLTSAREFDSVAIQAVKDPPSRPARELAMAEARFQQKVDAGEFVYWEAGENEGGDIDPDTETEEEEENAKLEQEEKGEQESDEEGSIKPWDDNVSPIAQTFCLTCIDPYR
jgi:hypothetical protein